MTHVRFKTMVRCPLCRVPVTLKEDGVVSDDDGRIAHARCLLEALRQEVSESMIDVFRALGHEDMREPFLASMLAEDLSWSGFILLIEQALQKMYAVKADDAIDDIERKSALQEIAAVLSKELMVEFHCDPPHVRADAKKSAAEGDPFLN